MGLLMNLKSFSQVAKLNNKDTIICFSVSQSKFLLKEHYRAEKFSILDSLSTIQLMLCDSIKKENNEIKERYKFLLTNKKEEIQLREYQIQKLNEQVKQLNRKVNRQKFYKVGYMVLLGGITTHLAYQKFIKK